MAELALSVIVFRLILILFNFELLLIEDLETVLDGHFSLQVVLGSKEYLFHLLGLTVHLEWRYIDTL